MLKPDVVRTFQHVARTGLLALMLSSCAASPPTPVSLESVNGAASAHAVQSADGPLSVPPTLTALTQPAGQKRLTSTADNQSYWPLSAYFETQKNQAYCSVATSVMALNALGIQRPKSSLYPDFPYFSQDDFFRSVDPDIANPARVSMEGMTLDQLADVLKSFPVSVRKYRATDLTLAQFRDLIRSTTLHGDRFVLLNFKRTSIGEVGGGHWSPLAAFDAATDSALLLDVARYKYPPVWVPLSQLYAGALEVDSVSGLARGVVIIGKPVS